MLAELASSIGSTWSGYLYGAALCGVLELLLPTERQSRWSWLRGAVFTGLSLAAAVLVTFFFRQAMNRFQIEPLFAWDLGNTIHSPDPLVRAAGYTVVPLLGVFLYDIGYYWFHRLQHTLPFLWRFHAVHHSIEELNAFNAYHHVSEYVWRIPLLTIPSSLLFSISEPQVVVMGTILHAVGVLAHGNVRLRFGPLRFLFVEPRFHRIHHSIERRHWNRNYSFYFPVLDLVFGTAHFPRADEDPATGIDYAREPRTLGAFLFPPKPPAAEPQPQSSTDQPRFVASSRSLPCGFTATASSAHSNTGASVT